MSGIGYFAVVIYFFAFSAFEFLSWLKELTTFYVIRDGRITTKTITFNNYLLHILMGHNLKGGSTETAHRRHLFKLSRSRSLEREFLGAPKTGKQFCYKWKPTFGFCGTLYFDFCLQEWTIFAEIVVPVSEEVRRDTDNSSYQQCGYYGDMHCWGRHICKIIENNLQQLLSC